MKKRMRMSRRSSKKSFRKGLGKRKRNKVKIMRGGYRL